LRTLSQSQACETRMQPQARLEPKAASPPPDVKTRSLA
jgi:hypothetical protein